MLDAYRFSRTEFLQAMQKAGIPSLLQLSYRLQLSPSQVYGFAEGRLPIPERRQQIAALFNVPESQLWMPCSCTHND